MPISVQANLPIAGVGVSGSKQRLIGGPWNWIKRTFRRSKPPTGPKVAKQGNQWVVHRPGRTTATVLASLVQTDERRSAPPFGHQQVQAAPRAPAAHQAHAAGHGHGASASGSGPAAGLDQLDQVLDDVEAAIDRQETLDREAQGATTTRDRDKLELDHRFQRAETGKEIDGALATITALRTAGALDQQQHKRLAAIEDRAYRSLIALHMPKLGPVLDNLRSGAVRGLLDHHPDAERLKRSFDPTDSGESLLTMPEQFARDVMQSMRTLHRAGTLDSDLMKRLASFGQTREWSSSDFIDDNWKAADSLETQLRLLATGNEGAINWLLGADRSQDDRALTMKLRLREVRAEQARRTGGKEREREVQPETLIRARHELRRANRDLGRLLTGTEEWHINRIFGRGSEIRIDTGVIKAMRRRFGKKVGRDVNLLLANVMLLQRKVDQLERQPTIDDLQAKLAAAKGDLDQQIDAARAESFDPDDRRQLEAAHLVDQALALNARLEQLEPLAHYDADKFVAMSDPEIDKFEKNQEAFRAARERRDAAGRELEDMCRKGLIDDATRQTIQTGPVQAREALSASVQATLAVDRATRDLAQATHDLKLGLDDRELKAVGLDDSEIADMHATIGRLVGQGLRSSDDVKRTTKAIQDGLELLHARTSQNTLGQLSRGFAESQANLLMDLVFQDVTGDHHNLDLTAGSEQVGAGFRDAMDRFLNDPRSPTAALEHYTASCARLQQDMANLSRQLVAADDRYNRALDQLLAFQSLQVGRTIHPQDRHCYTAATEIIGALRADARANDVNLDDTTRALGAAERDRILERLGGFDPNRMRVTSHGRKTHPDPPSAAELARLEPLARAIIEVHDHERVTAILSGQIEDKAKELDDVLAMRRYTMNGDSADPDYDPGTDVHRLVQNGVRAAALHVRREAGIPLDQFEPNQHREAILTVLAGFGIRPDLFAPEIDDTLHGAFGPEAVKSWVEDAKSTLADQDFATRLNNKRQTGLWQTLRQFFGRFITDAAPIDQSTRSTVVSMVKSLRPGDAIELGRDHALTLRSGRVPVVPVGAAALSVRASAAFARKNQLEIECNAHEIEVFLKAGYGGEGSLEAAVDATVAEVALSASLGGHRLQGVALRFSNTEQGRQDLAALMDNLMSERPEVGATTFARAEQVLMVTEGMIKSEAELEALSTTAMLNEKFGGVFSRTTAASDNGYPMDVSVGAKAQLGGGVEARVVRAENANSAVYEKEVEKDVAIHLRLGAFTEMASGYDVGLDQIPGLADPVSRTLSHGVRKDEGADDDDDAPAPYADQAFGGIPRTLAGVGYDVVVHNTTMVTRINQDTDGLYQSHGNELVRRLAVKHVSKRNGRVDTDQMLKSLALDMTDDPRGRGLETDPLTAALADHPEFRESVDAMMQQVRWGDRLSVTYTLDPAVRAAANELREEAASLRRQRGRDQTALARAKDLDQRAEDLVAAESSYLPLDVQIVKASATKVDADLANLKLIKLGRTGHGRLRRAAMTATNPGNPAARLDHGHGHGDHGPIAALAPEVYFGAPPSRRSAPPPGGQLPAEAPMTAPTSAVPDPSGPPAADLLKPALDRFGVLKREASLFLASPYRPLDGQLNHLREGLGTLAAAIESLDPDATLDLAGDLRSRLVDLTGAVNAAAKLPKAPDTSKLEQDYQAIKSRESEPLMEAIHRASDGHTLRTPGPVDAGQRFYAEDQQYAACAIHALNAFIGGPVVSAEAVSEFALIQAHRDQVAPQLDVPDIDARHGSEADLPYKMLRYLKDHRALTHDVAFHLIDQVSDDSSAQRNIPPIPGDRCIVNTQNPAHFVAFRRDKAGNWWKIDSAPYKNQTRMTPEAYIRDRMRQPDNGFIGVTTLAG